MICILDIINMISSEPWILFGSVINNGTFINNEYCDVYLVTNLAPIPLEAFTLQVRML